MTQYAPGYAPAAPYPPQQYPAAPAYPQPQYAPQYPPQQGWPAPVMAPPPPPLAQGSIDDFYAQPTTGGGAFLKFEHPGQTYAGFVARPIAQGDIRQQTTPPQQGSVPQFYRDGRPKFEMLIPLKVQPDAAHPDGLATWAVRGADRDELTRAMAEAGVPENLPPEADAFIQITFTELRPTRGGIAQKVKRVTYARPGQTPAVQYAPQAPAPVQYAPPAQPQQAPVQYTPPMTTTYAPPAQPVQQVQGAPAQPAAMPIPGSDSWTPQQRELMAKLAGQAAPVG